MGRHRQQQQGRRQRSRGHRRSGGGGSNAEVICGVVPPVPDAVSSSGRGIGIRRGGGNNNNNSYNTTPLKNKTDRLPVRKRRTTAAKKKIKTEEKSSPQHHRHDERRQRHKQQQPQNKPTTRTRRSSKPQRPKSKSKSKNRPAPPPPQPMQLQSVGAASIHRSWKQPLGGLIRWYVHKRTTTTAAGNGDDSSAAAASPTTVRAAEAEVERMYYQSQCSIEGTRDAILKALTTMISGGRTTSATTDVMDATISSSNNNNGNNSWIELFMVIPSDQLSANELKQAESSSSSSSSLYYSRSCDKKGFLLPVVERPGEGPAHAQERWKYVTVPSWAIHKSYYFQVNNRSPLALSCKMSIDSSSSDNDNKSNDAGDNAAKNAPVPANCNRTIKPADHRYFQSHSWVLTPAKKVKLSEVQQQQQQQVDQQQTALPAAAAAAGRKSSHRYNGIRPNYYKQSSGQQQQQQQQQQQPRISPVSFPDPTTFGWTFTGSNEQSRVEFFEKRINNLGCVVKLDFYYTTGTVKTVLDHPTTGPNQLFRRCKVEPDLYVKILQNPRVHSNIGYRFNDSSNGQPRPSQGGDDAIMEGVDDDAVPADENFDDQDNVANDEAMRVGDDKSSTTPYYAKIDGYNFQERGHENRKVAMEQLAPSQEYKAWQEAARTEYACVHAKFYVSIPHSRRRILVDRTKGGVVEPEPLPQAAPIIDVKAAEKANLATQFRATGPAVMPKPTSRIRMERIAGLNDNPDWGTGPVFECKLFYRAEEMMEEEESNDNDNSLEEDLAVVDDDDDEMEEEEEIPLADRLRESMPLQDYKTDKLLQLNQWHQQNKCPDLEIAEEAYNECKDSIQYYAQTSLAVDNYIKTYWDWHQKQEWNVVAATTSGQGKEELLL